MAIFVNLDKILMKEYEAKTPDELLKAPVTALAGVSEGDANVYAEGVRRGGTLVTARVPDADRTRYEAILDRSAVNIRERANLYQQGGWSRFDPNAPVYTEEQIRRERELYGRRV